MKPTHYLLLLALLLLIGMGWGVWHYRNEAEEAKAEAFVEGVKWDRERDSLLSVAASSRAYANALRQRREKDRAYTDSIIAHRPKPEIRREHALETFRDAGLDRLRDSLLHRPE